MQDRSRTASALVIVAVLVIGFIVLLQKNSAGAIGVNLTDNGCDPSSLVVPAKSMALDVTNQSSAGEFEILDQAGNSKIKVSSIKNGQTAHVLLHLKTGYYTVECGKDALISRLTVGLPKSPPVDLGSIAAPTAGPQPGYSAESGNSYQSINLVASDASYKPQIVDPAMLDAWGLANRPAGAGGHFWITANKSGSSLEYLGDVGDAPLYQNDLQTVSIPGVDAVWANSPKNAFQKGQPTGVVFNPYNDRFIVDQGAVKGASKFIFAGQDGTISAWTEQNNPNGSVTQLAWATKVSDQSGDPEDQIQFFGLAIAPGGDRLLAADFGSNPQIRSFDSSFNAVPTSGFVNPFIKVGSELKPNDLLPWNITTIGDKIYVCYAAIGAQENDPQKVTIAEENHAHGAGRVVVYNADGSINKILDDKGSLDAPWGITVAPNGFGKLTGDLLVANFGDGSIAAFKPDGTFADWVRKPDNSLLVVPGIWALLPGNGASLGSAQDVYFTAGPNAEQAGVFGKIKLQN